MFVGLLLKCHVGLRQCRLMDGSPEEHCAQKTNNEESTLTPSLSPGEELTGEGSAGSLYPTDVQFCQSGWLKKQRQILGSGQHIHMGSFLYCKQICLTSNGNNTHNKCSYIHLFRHEYYTHDSLNKQVTVKNTEQL